MLMLITDNGNIMTKSKSTREIPFPNDDERWQEAMDSWDKRADREQARIAVDILQELADDYEDEPLAWAWVARGWYWLGDSTREKDERRECFGEGHEAAKIGLKLDPASVPLNFWGGCCLAQYAKDSNPIAQATQLPALMGMMKVVYKKEPDYFYGGLSRLLAIAMAHAPTLAGKALKAMGLNVTIDGLIGDIEKAVAKDPGCISNYMTMAEVYRGLKKMDKAREWLEKGKAVGAKAIPGIAAENALDLERIERRLKEW